MKKVFVTIIVGCNVLSVWAQADDIRPSNLPIVAQKIADIVVNSKVSIDIDTTLFKKQERVYRHESANVTIMTLVLPVTSFENLKNSMDRKAERFGISISEKGELQTNGKSLVYRKGTFGIEKSSYKELYAILIDSTRVIYLLGSCPINLNEDLSKVILQAAISAEIVP